MIDPVTMNARKPRDDEHGHAMLSRMNERHKALHKWALEHVSLDGAQAILDVGFGGGEGLRNMSRLAPEAQLWGVDPSEASLRKCSTLNHEAIAQGKIHVRLGAADDLPDKEEFFDLVTAFETTYYWPRIVECFRNIHRVLKDKGAFLICNEDSHREGNEELMEALDMNIYTAEELKELLLQAGFATVHTYDHTKGNWICVVGIR